MDFKKMAFKYDMTIRGVIHIGAHYGQEYKTYKEMGIDHVLLIEPLEKNYNILVERCPDAVCIKTALGNFVGKSEMFVEDTNRGQSSSLLEPRVHLLQYPDIKFTKKEVVDVTTLDDLIRNTDIYNFINIDVQGYELEVFKGGTETLKRIDYIYAEVNNLEMYKGCPMVKELDKFLEKLGFRRKTTEWVKWGINNAWGDALYIKK